MDDTVDNQGADTLGCINGRETFKRSWKVLNELVKSTKRLFSEKCSWESER